MEKEHKKSKVEYYKENADDAQALYLKKASVLVEALPYIKEYFNKIVVVKLGGSMMEDDDMLQKVLDDITLMKYVGIKVVIIHGGGKQITGQMQEKNIDVKFVDGLRVTSSESIKVVQMVLLGIMNTKIVSMLNRHGSSAVGICGNDGNFIFCSKKYYQKGGKKIDLGFVGEIENIDSGFVFNILNNGHIPVIASLGTDMKGNIYNINADTCASEIAVALSAEKMILLTDVDGIIDKAGSRQRLVSRLDTESCMEMIDNAKIGQGMIPKVKACIDSLIGGVSRTHILNGTKIHSLLIEIFTDKGIGTMIIKKGVSDGR